MRVFQAFGLTFFSKYLLVTLNFSLLTLSPNIDARLVQISPRVPNYIDPILQNLPTVMDNFYQPPTYPGSIPYLSMIQGTFNLFNEPNIAINPKNDNFVVAWMNLDRITDSSGIYNAAFPFQILNSSKDGGFSWSNSFPAFVQSTLSLGGTISQQIGFTGRYDKCGDLLVAGLFNDMHPNPPNAQTIGGLLFSRSKDNGMTWVPPLTLDTGVSRAFVHITGDYTNGPTLVSDPGNSDLIHIAYVRTSFPAKINGNIFYVRSTDGGKVWSSPKQIYSMTDDPLWVAEHLDPNFSPPGGQSFSSAIAVYNENTLLVSIQREYPKIGSPTFTGSVLDTNWDKAVIRSTDKGKTWHPIAGATEQYIDPFVHDPAGNGPPLFTGNKIFSGDLASPIVVSTNTGRVYITYMAGNTDISTNPLVARGYPRLLLNASQDGGVTWSPAVQINQTPTNIPTGNQQAFFPSIIFANDGWVAIAYYDFRNWTGGTINDPLQTDVWMDIYREVSDLNGGSTGLGLDFIKEVRLTPTSYDARISLENGLGARITNGAVGFGTALALNKKNEILAAFGMTHPSPPITTIGYKGMQIQTNNFFNLYINRVKLPKPSNE